MDLVCASVVQTEYLTLCLHNRIIDSMFVGRKYELGLIRDRLADDSKAQLIIIYGRRRIGKSTLIREAVKDEKNVLFFEGIEGGRKTVQIDQFLTDLARQTGRVRIQANNWREVFQGVGEVIQAGRWTLVFDELPWMGAGRTQIVSELKLYWDRWSHNPYVNLFICGSIASFMTRHVVHSKALHNRKTLELCLGPLLPHEVGLFIPKRSVREKAQLYMCLGGVPKYLEQVDPRYSLKHNLNRLCFSAKGFFLQEYETLFKEQFRSFKVYESIVESLAQAPSGLSELSRRVGRSKGGGFQEQVNNLVRAQFVKEYSPVTLERRRTRTRIYKLVDPFLRFYFRYIHINREVIARNTRGENLLDAIAGPSLAQYYGHAFERLCEDGLAGILDSIGLRLADIRHMGPYFRQKRSEQGGLQIDWMLVRRDAVWTLMEFKYLSSPIGKEVIREVEQKIDRLNVPRDISLETVLITGNGVTNAVRVSGYFNHILGLDNLITNHPSW